jgi:hypothetical protein
MARTADRGTSGARRVGSSLTKTRSLAEQTRFDRVNRPLAGRVFEADRL